MYPSSERAEGKKTNIPFQPQTKGEKEHSFLQKGRKRNPSKTLLSFRFSLLCSSHDIRTDVLFWGCSNVSCFQVTLIFCICFFVFLFFICHSIRRNHKKKKKKSNFVVLGSFQFLMFSCNSSFLQ